MLQNSRDMDVLQDNNIVEDIEYMYIGWKPQLSIFLNDKICF